MAIMSYTGVMGSGKTYEGVGTAALTALRSGRRVVTNITGFNYEAIRDYLGLLAGGNRLESDRVVVISSKRITEPNFFHDPDNEESTVVQPGDLVLIDEVWAFWGTDKKLLPEHQKFFRMHRHYTEAGTGTACDLVILIQDLSSLHRFVRGVLETTLKFTKMKSLGLTSCYRVEVYEGSKQTKSTLVSVNVKRYDKRIFPLYKSYDNGSGTERVVDDRQNLFRNKWFLLSLVIAVILLGSTATWLYRWVSRAKTGGVEGASSAHQPLTPGTAVSTPSGPGQLQLPSSPGQQFPKDSRLVGIAELSNGETLVIFQIDDGRYIRQSMTSGILNGWQTTAGLNGRMTGFAFSGGKK